MRLIQFNIVTQEGVVYESEATQITLPTTSGEVSILPHHAPLVSLVSPGTVMIKKIDGEHLVSVARGILEVRHDSKVIILAESAERAETIDLERAEAARARAQQVITEKEKLSNEAFAAVQAQLEKEIARIKVGRRYRKLPPL